MEMTYPQIHLICLYIGDINDSRQAADKAAAARAEAEAAVRRRAGR
jgi:hypothetical protein